MEPEGTRSPTKMSVSVCRPFKSRRVSKHARQRHVEMIINKAWPLIWSLVAALSLSLILNIFFCISKCCSVKKMWRHGSQRSQGSRQMEENPIYGNLLFPETKDDPPRSSLNSSSVRDQHRVNLTAQNQDCYANLALKAPRAQSACSSAQVPPTQYSDVVHLEQPAEKQEHDDDDDGVTDGASVMSDLYASVQTQRAKTIDAADGGEGYANHL